MGLLETPQDRFQIAAIQDWTVLIPAVSAGILTVCEEFVYSESVPGALQSLARDGVTPTRALATKTEGIIHIEENTPEFFYDWIGPELHRVNSPNSTLGSPLADLVPQLTEISRRCPDWIIIEWLEDPAGTILAIDSRPAPTGFLGDLQAIRFGLLRHSLESLPAAGDGPFHDTFGRRPLLIERPLYSFVSDGSVFEASRVVLERGGLLAHLVVECARRRIPCVISEDQYKDRAETAARLSKGN